MYPSLRTKTLQQGKEPATKPIFTPSQIVVWIDHRQAVVFKQEKKNVISRHTVVSERMNGAEGRRGYRGSPPGRGHMALVSERNHLQWLAEKEKSFLSNVIGLLRGAGRIVIMGPGLMKLKLSNLLKVHKTLGDVLEGEPRPCERMGELELERVAHKLLRPKGKEG